MASGQGTPQHAPRRDLDPATLLARSVLGPQSPTTGLVDANIDSRVRPQDDLFRHANGRWLTAVPIPADRSRWGIYEMMTERTMLQLRDLLSDEGNATDRDTAKAIALYASFMDERRVEMLDAQPLRRALARIDAIRTTADLSAALGDLLQQAVRLPLKRTITVDARNGGIYALYFTQWGLGLPDRDYYVAPTRDNPTFAKTRGAYRAHIAKMLAMAEGRDLRGAEAIADRILAFETKLANAHWTRVEARDAVKTYNKLTPSDMAALSNGLFGKTFFAALDVPDDAPLVVEQPSYVEAVGRLKDTVALDDWKAYLRFNLISKYAQALSSRFVREDFGFRGTALAGVERLPARWKRGVRLVDEEMGEAASKMYVARWFPPRTKAQVEALVANLVRAFHRSIDDSNWMSDATKAEAHAKLDHLEIKVGHPVRWRDYSALTIDRNDVAGNVERTLRFEFRRRAAQLGQPVARDEFWMTPATVNAYYHPVFNEIVLLAAILQPPLYVPGAIDAYNYGALGATIGHELSHGFDDQGSRYDSAGRLRNWWTAEDRHRFDAKVDRLASQYDAYEPVPGFRVDGRLTVGENLADLAGAEIAWRAYRLALNGRPPAAIDGRSSDEIFFLAYAQSTLAKQRTVATITQLKSDPHAPDAYRVNGVVVNMAPFADTFGVRNGDGLWRPAGERARLWE